MNKNNSNDDDFDLIITNVLECKICGNANCDNIAMLKDKRTCCCNCA